MTYGVEIRNNSSELIISSANDNMQVQDKGSVTATYTGQQAGGYILAWKDTGGLLPIGDESLLFFKYPDSITPYVEIALGRGFYTDTGGATVACPTLYVNSSSSSDINIDYIKVNKASQISATGSGYGFEVYKDNGDLAYSSSLEAMPANGFIINSGSTQSYTVESGKDIWVCGDFGAPTPFNPSSVSTSFRKIGIIRTSSTEISTAITYLGIGGGGPPVTAPASPSNLFIMQY